MPDYTIDLARGLVSADAVAVVLVFVISSLVLLWGSLQTHTMLSCLIACTLAGAWSCKCVADGQLVRLTTLLFCGCQTVVPVGAAPQ